MTTIADIVKVFEPSGVKFESTIDTQKFLRLEFLIRAFAVEGFDLLPSVSAGEEFLSGLLELRQKARASYSTVKAPQPPKTVLRKKNASKS